MASGSADLGLLTPLPATPLYKGLETAGRRTRPKHWQEFIPLAMAHTPLKMSIDEAHSEVRIGWANSYSPEAIEKAVDSLNDKSLGYRINILMARLCFRGIYFPQMGRFVWVKTILENRRTILKLMRQGFGEGLHAAAPSFSTSQSQSRNTEALPPEPLTVALKTMAEAVIHP